MNTKRRGSLGESLGVDYLQKKGYRILQQNYRFERGEIDIVAEDGEVLVFVEVKARTSAEYGDPIEAVTPAKQSQIRKVANGYLYEHEIEDRECRFDVVAIRFQKGKAEIEHYISAF